MVWAVLSYAVHVQFLSYAKHVKSYVCFGFCAIIPFQIVQVLSNQCLLSAVLSLCFLGENSGEQGKRCLSCVPTARIPVCTNLVWLMQLPSPDTSNLYSFCNVYGFGEHWFSSDTCFRPLVLLTWLEFVLIAMDCEKKELSLCVLQHLQFNLNLLWKRNGISEKIGIIKLLVFTHHLLQYTMDSWSAPFCSSR